MTEKKFARSAAKYCLLVICVIFFPMSAHAAQRAVLFMPPIPSNPVTSGYWAWSENVYRNLASVYPQLEIVTNNDLNWPVLEIIDGNSTVIRTIGDIKDPETGAKISKGEEQLDRAERDLEELTKKNKNVPKDRPQKPDVKPNKDEDQCEVVDPGQTPDLGKMYGEKRVAKLDDDRDLARIPWETCVEAGTPLMAALLMLMVNLQPTVNLRKITFFVRGAALI